jgi:N-acetyltransferase 10
MLLLQIISDHNQEFGKVVVRVNVFRDHRQCIQYIEPSDDNKLSQAELVAIDEAAAIPLPTVKKLMNSGTYLTFLSSTINGYEGTGRSLSLKLIAQLRQQQGQAMASAAKSAGNSVVGPKSNKGERHLHEDRWKAAAAAASSSSATLSSSSVRKLTELALEEPIRYGSGDPIEKWLNSLLCLDCGSVAANNRLVSVMPSPKDCELYMVNRDALFSYHALSESLLQRIWALYTAAHYKNSPNDLQMLSDAPAHRLFVLLGPQRSSSGAQLPDVLCVVQIAFEGFISQQSVQSEIQRGNKASGDLIPWSISQQFNDNKFASLSGVRIVRIATHPDVQKMGYGSRAIDILCSYFRGEISIGAGPSPAVGEFGGEGAVGDDAIIKENAASASNQENGGGLLGESLKPRKKLPPLMTALADRPSERLHWIGVSYGLTSQLLNFWSRKGFKACYLRQTKNELTGEHSCIVLKEVSNIVGGSAGIGHSGETLAAGWLDHFVSDYRRRLISLMSYSFAAMETSLAITLVDPDRVLTSSGGDGAGDDDAISAAVDVSSNSSSSSSLELNAGMAGKLTAQELVSVHLSQHDLKRLDLYSRNMVDHHMILDTVPILTRLLFLQRIDGIRLSFLQVAIILAVGLQHRDVDSIATELDIPVSQVLAFFNKTVRKIAGRLSALVEADIAKRELPTNQQIKGIEKNVSKHMNTLVESLADEQKRDEREFNAKIKAALASEQAATENVASSKEFSKYLDKAAKASNSVDAALSGLSGGAKVPNRISVAVPAEPKSQSDAHEKKDKKNKKRKDGNEDVADGEGMIIADDDEGDNQPGHGKKQKKHKKDKH